jgi:hypothetical protein
MKALPRRSPSSDRARRPARGASAFVGRSAELRLLSRLLREAARGAAQTVVLRGPAGIGKTRLAEEVAARARRQGARVGAGWGWPDGAAPPLWPWRTVLRELGVPGGALDEGSREAPGRFARFVAVADHLRAAARAASLVIVLDDLHLADPATLQLARFVAREGRTLPLLLLLSLREETGGLPLETRELLSDLTRTASVVTLSGLSQDDVCAYLAAAGEPRPRPEVLRALMDVTRGNPLHLRSVASQSRLEAGGLLGGLERAIETLLERLSAADRRLLALAALLGTEVSVHELAAVAGVPPALAAAALARAAALGLAREAAGGRFAFVHEALRGTARSSLGVADRLEAHARAAALLTGPEPDQMAQRAHHALAAANRSKEDARNAVAIAREAAAALRGVDGYESAAALLEAAAEVQAAAMPEDPAAALAVERAEAVLACGHLSQARALFHRAARLAEKEGAADALARAALGLGGVWVREHRLPDEDERVRALQQRALVALPREAEVLRARLAVRLRAEEAYHGAPVAPVLEALEDARATADACALAEALSLAHHALMTPEHTWRRLPLATEMIAAAAVAGEGLLALVGLCWRAADLFLLGDGGAAAALAELRLRADALHCRSILFVARVMEVMLAIRGGRFAEAERLAAACCEAGREVGDADALAYYGAHLVAIRSFQGREPELAGAVADIAASPTLIEGGAQAFALTAALLSLRGGRPEAARGMLRDLARQGLAAVPASSSWLTTMLVVVELASALGDEAVSAAAYDALLPYADLPVMASLACVCFGSVHRLLGVAALAGGRVDPAVAHLEAAVTANERLDHRPAAIQARGELALAYLRRGRGDDAARGRLLLAQATAAAEAAGMGGLAERWRGAPSASHPADLSLGANRRWRVALDGETATVRDCVGIRYLARLAAAPDREVPALALAASGCEGPDAGRPDAVLDRRALAALRQRIRALEQQPAATAAEQEELAALRAQLRRTLGLRGRIRSFPDASERARTAVRKAIKRALDELAAANPALSEHLSRHLETGAACCYRLACRH